MSKKNVVVGAILGFFVIGLFYAKGLNKQSVLLVLGLCILCSLISMVGGPASIIVNFVGGYLGYKWCTEYNANLEGTAVQI